MSEKTGRQAWAARVRRGWQWISGREAAVLVAVLLIVLGTWCFIEVADEVVEGETLTFDAWVVTHVRRADNPKELIGPEWVKEMVVEITSLGGWPVLTLFVLVVAGYLLLERKYHAMWLVLIAPGAGWGVISVLKALFGRERPDVVPHLVHEASMSFPSGHAMMSAVVYLTLGALLTRLVRRVATRIYILSVAVLLTLLVGLSRVFLGVHYPTDVLAGWSAGLVWAMLCWLVARKLQQRGKVERPEGEGGVTR